MNTRPETPSQPEPVVDQRHREAAVKFRGAWNAAYLDQSMRASEDGGAFNAAINAGAKVLAEYFPSRPNEERRKETRCYDKCPACGNDTLAVDEHHHLLCTWISCPDPCRLTRMLERQSPTNEERLREALEKLMPFVREFDEDLDETACPTGGMSCPTCGGGGKRKLKHVPSCELEDALIRAKEALNPQLAHMWQVCTCARDQEDAACPVHHPGVEIIATTEGTDAPAPESETETPRTNGLPMGQREMEPWERKSLDEFTERELASETKQQGEGAWRPIETAPRDGTVVLGFIPRNKGVRCVFWKQNQWVLTPGTWCEHPTLWQPLPDPSRDASEREGE